MTVARANKPPLLATWGGIGLVRNMKATLNDTPPKVWNGRTELIERLLADTCELCGSHEHVEVHHIRALRDLQTWGRAERPHWVEIMAARQRKTLAVCHTCHRQIHHDGHAGKVTARRRRHGLPESRMRVRHEAHGCNEREFHSSFQVGDVPLERSGQERFPDGERAAPKRPGEMELGHQDARLGKATIG